jgi:hypothetical protein
VQSRLANVSPKGVRKDTRIAHIPESNDVITGFPELGKSEGESRLAGSLAAKTIKVGLTRSYSLITDEAKGEYINQCFHGVKITSGVDGIDGAGVQGQVDKREEQLGGVLVHGRPHSIRIKMGEERWVVTSSEFDERGRVIFVLNQPSLPEVTYAFLYREVSN